MIIALEGGICSGKTTLAKEFESQDFYLIPEYMDIIQPCEENKIRDLTASKHSAINVFLEIEKRRKKIYLENSKGKNIILDRSYLTLFAYEYAIGRNICNMEFPDLYKNVIIPNIIVFLDVNDALRMKRSHDRCDENMPKTFLNHTFNSRLKKFFLQQNQFPCVFLNTENLTPSKMVNSLKSMQFKNTQSPQQWFMDKFYNLR
jgi:thymidylate kinase